VLGQAVNKAANDKANAPNKDWPFVAFFIRCRILASVRCRTG